VIVATSVAQRVLVWGGGGHGKVVADLIRACDMQVVGFVDRDPAKRGLAVEPGGARILLLQNEFEELLATHGHFAERATCVALGIGDNRVRLQCARALDDCLMPGLVHPRASVSPCATLGAGSVVFAGAVLNPDARVGDAVIVNTGAVIGHDCTVGHGAHISPNATLTGAASVGRGAWVGAGAVVLPGVRVGDGAIVGAGAVVRRDVPDLTTVVGIPARVLRKSAPERT